MVYDISTVTPGAANALICTPTMDEPAEGEWFDSSPSWFRWVNQPSADHYELQVASDPAFSNVLWDISNLVSSVYMPATNLPFASTNWCRVRSFAPVGTSSHWSPSVSFQVGIVTNSPPASPALKLLKSSDTSELIIYGSVRDINTPNGLANVTVTLNNDSGIVQSTTSDQYDNV